MMKSVIILAVTLIAVYPGLAFATTITISLPDLEGPVPSDPDLVSAIINLGTSFQDIQDVRIVCNGFIHPGSGIVHRRDGVDVLLPYFSDIRFTIAGDSKSASAYIGPDEYGIVGDESLFDSWEWGFNWDFLLDGQAEIKASLLGPGLRDPYTLLKESTATITEAYLIIEGTPIPEPVSLLLFGFGGLILRKGALRAGS